MRTPRGLSAVGWRIAVYWTLDQEFYYGRVVHYDKDEETQYKYSIKYDDGEALHWASAWCFCKETHVPG